MKNCQNNSIQIGAYRVEEIGGGEFRAYNREETIIFKAEGRNGGLYFMPKSVYKNGRLYTAGRFLQRYILTVRELAFYLADNDYLWDYLAQKPLLETRPPKQP